MNEDYYSEDEREIAGELAAAGLLPNASDAATIEREREQEIEREARRLGFTAYPWRREGSYVVAASPAISAVAPRRYRVLERQERRMRPLPKKPRRVGIEGMHGERDAVVILWGEDFVTLDAPDGYFDRPEDERGLARFVPEPGRWKLPDSKKDPWPFDRTQEMGEPWDDEVRVTVAALPVASEVSEETAALMSVPRGGPFFGRRRRGDGETVSDDGTAGGNDRRSHRGWDLLEDSDVHSLRRGDDVLGWHLAWSDPTGEPPGRPASVLTEAITEAALANISTREDFARLTRRGGRRTEAERQERQALGARVAAALRQGKGMGIEKLLTEIYGCNRTTLHRLAALAGPSMQQ